MTSALIIDGSHGEGGGQIVRTSLALSAITGRPLRLEIIRAGRRKPGLAAQHLTGVRAAAAICDARLEGDALGSQRLSFVPAGPPRAGDYRFDVAAASRGGSAGSTGLVLQTVLMPLALARGTSTVTIGGGTHVAWSPPFDFLREVWLPALEPMGVVAELELDRWGWYPVGRGEIRVRIDGLGDSEHDLRPVRLTDRGELVGITGRAAASRLPGHIPRRMAERASEMLIAEGLRPRIESRTVAAAGPGTGLFLTARYTGGRAGFSALGRRGKPAEEVAAEAAAALLEHHHSGAAIDRHLADQLILPAALAAGESRYSVSRVTQHLVTNAWTVERFGLAEITIERSDDGSAAVTIKPRPHPERYPPSSRSLDRQI